MEYLFPGLAFPTEPRSTAASMEPSREAKFQHNGQHSTNKPVGAVHGPDVKGRPRKGQVGAAGHSVWTG